jgi:hypothetical protein
MITVLKWILIVFYRRYTHSLKLSYWMNFKSFHKINLVSIIRDVMAVVGILFFVFWYHYETNVIIYIL